MVMLPGSLCPSSSMSYLYDIWKEDFYIIAPDYNGYDENSTFSTRQGEAKGIVQYLKKQGITHIKMVYGQSMVRRLESSWFTSCLMLALPLIKRFSTEHPASNFRKHTRQLCRQSF
jgi:hypothetical protein